MSTYGKPSFPILDGGNKFELFAQLTDVGRVQNRPSFWFTLQHPNLRGSVAPKQRVSVRINGIEAESGDGESWLLTGYIVDINNEPQWLRDEFPGGNSFVRAYFNTRDRKGTLSYRY